MTQQHINIADTELSLANEKMKLEVNDLRLYYGDSLALKNINLQIPEKRVTAFIGPSGCGKSTLLKIIFGTMQAEHKFIRLNGKVEQHPYKVKNGITYLPQDNYIPNHLTVKKTIDLSLHPEKRSICYEDTLLKNLLHAKIGSLSGGELKYLQVKLLLYNDSKFCLLDEPYSGISPIMAETINALLLEQSKEKGIIITDHNYRFLLPVATKLYLLKNGVGKFIKNKEALISSGYLKNEMLEE